MQADATYTPKTIFKDHPLVTSDLWLTAAAETEFAAGSVLENDDGDAVLATDSITGATFYGVLAEDAVLGTTARKVTVVKHGHAAADKLIMDAGATRATVLAVIEAAGVYAD